MAYTLGRSQTRCSDCLSERDTPQHEEDLRKCHMERSDDQLYDVVGIIDVPVKLNVSAGCYLSPRYWLGSSRSLQMALIFLKSSQYSADLVIA